MMFNYAIYQDHIFVDEKQRSKGNELDFFNDDASGFTLIEKALLNRISQLVREKDTRQLLFTNQELVFCQLDSFCTEGQIIIMLIFFDKRNKRSAFRTLCLVFQRSELENNQAFPLIYEILKHINSHTSAWLDRAYSPTKVLSHFQELQSANVTKEFIVEHMLGFDTMARESTITFPCDNTLLDVITSLQQFAPEQYVFHPNVKVTQDPNELQTSNIREKNEIILCALQEINPTHKPNVMYQAQFGSIFQFLLALHMNRGAESQGEIYKTVCEVLTQEKTFEKEKVVEEFSHHSMRDTVFKILHTSSRQIQKQYPNLRLLSGLSPLAKKQMGILNLRRKS